MTAVVILPGAYHIQPCIQIQILRNQIYWGNVLRLWTELLELHLMQRLELFISNH